jgi:hypothetical protein
MDAISQIGSFLGSGAGKGLLQGGAIGGGFLQNWLANREAQKKQQFVEGLISNPAKFSAYVSQLEKPLSSGLTTDIARETDAYGAERGLGSSGPVMKDVYAQALAPYQQQSQQMALQQALQGLGLYENSPTTKPVDLTSILKMFMSPQQPGGMPGATPPVNPSVSWMGGGSPSILNDSGAGTGGAPFDFSSLVDAGALAGGPV